MKTIDKMFDLDAYPDYINAYHAWGYFSDRMFPSDEIGNIGALSEFYDNFRKNAKFLDKFRFRFKVFCYFAKMGFFIFSLPVIAIIWVCGVLFSKSKSMNKNEKIS